MNYKATFINIDDKNINWICSINGYTFEYHQGFGFIKYKKEPETIVVRNLTEGQKISICKSRKLYGSITLWDINNLDVIWIKKPELDSLLYCLFLDSDAINYSFNDWCDSLGYDNDSIKAKKIYDDCIENYHKLKKALGNNFYSEKKRIEDLEL